MKIKQILRTIIRNILFIKSNESISDGIDRHYYHIRKKFPYKKIHAQEFNEILKELEIKKGDTVIVHASWRAMYMLDMTPGDVVKSLLEIVKYNGTIIMPCYGSDDTYFSVESTPSAAGVLSEELRNMSGSVRSCFPKFSMVANGYNAIDIVSSHVKSRYQFDDKSPYSIATKIFKSKILLLGLGEKPHKISVFHCASYDSQRYNSFYLKCYSKRKKAKIITEEGEKTIKYFDRFPEFQNNKKTFRNLFYKVKKRRVIKYGLVAISFDAMNAYNICYNFCKNGGKIYKYK